MIQVLGGSGLAALVIALVVPIVLVAFGTYVGVLMALQEFFGAESWDEAIGRTEE
ncbi:hypothetical protein [Haloarchaeobius baliensis]|uniref:hypothetical protein n=1 Tax=Haloarchaeobius baliensis TaxID=1670458 RepID=UPI003F885D01